MVWVSIRRPKSRASSNCGGKGASVSGTTAMLRERDPYVQKALDIGVSLFAGEAEGDFGDIAAADERQLAGFQFVFNKSHGVAIAHAVDELRNAGAARGAFGAEAFQLFADSRGPPEMML